MKLDFAEFKDFFQPDELEYNKKIVLLHPFLKVDSSNGTDESSYLSSFMKWHEAINKYFSGINNIELYIAFELYYYGSYYFAGGFGENQEFFEKNILTIVEKIKNIPQSLLPKGERLPMTIFKKIVMSLKYDEYNVEAYITTQNIMSKKEILNQYFNMSCWQIKTLDNNIRIITNFDSILTKVMWNDCRELQNSMEELTKYIDIIEIK